jgi:hypothetical protein
MQMRMGRKVLLILCLALAVGLLLAPVPFAAANPGVHGFPIRLTITSPVESGNYGQTVKVYAAAGIGHYTVSQYETISSVNCFVDGSKIKTINGSGFFASEISNLTLGFHNLTLSGISTWGNTVISQSTFEVTDYAPVGNYWKVLENPPKLGYQACDGDGAVYFFDGGYNYSTKLFNETLVKYNWQSKTFSSVASLAESEAPVIVTMVSVESKVYVFLRGDYLGGNYSSLGPLVFDTATNTIRNASFSPNSFSPGWDETKGVAADGVIYITSYLYWRNSSQAFYRYTPANDSWQELPPLPTEVWDYAITSLGGKIYVIGGYNPQTYVANQNVQVFDVEENSWSQFPAPVSFPSTAACSEIGENGHGVIYVVGPNSTQLYYPETNQWVEGAIIPTRAAPANLVSMDSGIYALGSTGDIGYDVSLEYVPLGCEVFSPTTSPEPPSTPTSTPTSTIAPTASPGVQPTSIQPSNTPTATPSLTPSPSAPEFPTWAVIPLLIAIAVTTAAIIKKKPAP